MGKFSGKVLSFDSTCIAFSHSTPAMAFIVKVVLTVTIGAFLWLLMRVREARRLVRKMQKANVVSAFGIGSSDNEEHT
jgi:hypothetical protein